MIIQSILDTDLYKFTTSYAYMTLYPQAEGTFTFNDRGKVEYTSDFLEALKLEFIELSHLSLQNNEFIWLTYHPVLKRFMPSTYWEWLKEFRFDFTKIKVDIDKSGNLKIDVTDKLYKVTLYEVPILAIVSELHYKYFGQRVIDEEYKDKLINKINLSNREALYFSEFGTRRRHSFLVQDYVCKYLKDHATYCVGTSNVYLAMKYGMVPVGTFPHEWVMFHGACFGYQMANYLALEDWSKVYDGDLGIALMDTYTTDVFLKNFSRKQAKLFDGVRQDSGDEYEIGNKVIARYKELGIDPTTKSIVFSNALNMEKYLDIASYFKGRIKVSAGIGTNLTNDCGFPPVNIVMKLSKVRINDKQSWRECIKISDDKGKHMGPQDEVDYCLKVCK